MAKPTYKKKEESIPYNTLERALKAGPPARVYMLRGDEDYLRDQYLGVLRDMCVPEGLDSFNYRRINGPKLELRELSEAVESMPFMGERTLVEVRDFDVNKTSDYDGTAFAALLADIPEWATLVFIFAPGYAPDGRLGPVKAIRKCGVDAQFTPQEGAQLIRWVMKHFGEEGKQCPSDVAEHLLYVCGSLMNTLLPEIVKIAGAAKGESITKRDIDAVAERRPDTKVYEMTDLLGQGDYDRAAKKLAELLDDKSQSASGLLYMISEQMRQLYCAKVAPRGAASRSYMLECFPELAARSFLIPKLVQTANRYSLPRLSRAVTLCAECEFSMRNGGMATDSERLGELLVRLAMDRSDG